MIAARHLLLVDHDAPTRLAVSEALRAMLGVSVREVGSRQCALDAVAAERFDVAILDVELPDGDGRDLCTDLRRLGLQLPILMLTEASQEEDVVRGLDAGANDCVFKPFRPYEMAAPVRAQLRQHEASEHAQMRVGHLLFRPHERTLSEPGRSRPARLTVKEAAVLKYLYRANEAFVPRDELLRQVWGYSPEAATHTVETHVYRLRRKIEPHADSPRVLLQERGGYRLVTAETAALATSDRTMTLCGGLRSAGQPHDVCAGTYSNASSGSMTSKPQGFAVGQLLTDV